MRAFWAPTDRRGRSVDRSTWIRSCSAHAGDIRLVTAAWSIYLRWLGVWVASPAHNRGKYLMAVSDVPRAQELLSSGAKGLELKLPVSRDKRRQAFAAGSAYTVFISSPLRPALCKCSQESMKIHFPQEMVLGIHNFLNLGQWVGSCKALHRPRGGFWGQVWALHAGQCFWARAQKPFHIHGDSDLCPSAVPCRWGCSRMLAFERRNAARHAPVGLYLRTTVGGPQAAGGFHH